MSVSAVCFSRLLRCARCVHPARCVRVPGVRWHTTRLDMDGSGRPATWDSFGIWDNRIEEPILLPPSIRYGTPIPHISLSRVGCATLIGRRRENEDRFQVSELTQNVLYFALFDGHGGAHAADYCHKHMEQNIRDCLEMETDLQTVLSKAFLEVDAALEEKLQIYGNASLMMVGTTATVALLRDGIELVVGSVGDSRALLCRKGKSRKLTDDHTPERKDEKHSCSTLTTPSWSSPLTASTSSCPTKRSVTSSTCATTPPRRQTSSLSRLFSTALRTTAQ
ncbi:protein phosphatase Mn(2+)-dependent 1K isoform X2 [Danio rerio]|uniref:Protein phosphatase Mn(2+)-dependent 1K isoform X2 n=1 Tax=Danio rerio TaxID=7955 RepID=A0AC58IMS6_DANRE